MPTSATTVEDSELAEQGSRFIGRRMPILPKRLPHPLDLLSPDYQLARAMDYFEQAQRLVDEVGEDPDWRNRQEFADLVYDIGKICETINNLLERPQWPLSKCTRVKHESRDACALAKQTSNTVRQEARKKLLPLPKPKDVRPPLSPMNSEAQVTRVVIESRPQIPDISRLTDASSMLSSLPDTETDAQSMSTRENLDDDTSSTRPILNYPDLPVA